MNNTFNRIFVYIIIRIDDLLIVKEQFKSLINIIIYVRFVRDHNCRENVVLCPMPYAYKNIHTHKMHCKRIAIKKKKKTN